MTIILILIVPIITALISLFIRKNIFWLELFSAVSGAVEFILAILISKEVLLSGVFGTVKYFSVDALGAIVLLTVATVGFMASIYSIGYFREEVRKQIIGFHRVKQFFILLNLFLGAMFLAIVTVNPIVMWIAIEATTLSTAFLVSFYNKPSAMEAAWKYLTINSIGLLLGFFGTILFFTVKTDAGAEEFLSWKTLLDNFSTLDPIIVKMAFVFILIGYGTKAGLVPMHTWKPDAYSKAPSPIAALFSGSLLNVALLSILRFKLITDKVVGTFFSSEMLIFFGAISILVPAFIILNQKNYKRLLAYSSVEHIGIICLGFGLGGIGTFAALLHMVYHSLAKSAMFFSFGNVFLKYSSTKRENIRGVLSALPITGIILIIGFLIATGVPPFGIFITEIYILSVAVVSSPLAFIIMISSLAIVFIGFLKYIEDISFGSLPASVSKGEINYFTIIPPIAMILILVYLSFVMPSSLKALIDSAVNVINI